MIRKIVRAFRSAITGRFVTRDFAEDHSAETVRERIHPIRPDHRKED